MNELHRGRLIDHLHLVVADFEKSKRFYTALLGAVGVPIGGKGPGFFWADELFVSSLDSPASAGKLAGRVHFAFQAASREGVDAAYQAGLAAGGTDNRKPGERRYDSGYYVAV